MCCSHLDSLGSDFLRCRCLVWIFIYQQQPTDTAYRLFAYGDKRGMDSLERFPPTALCCSTTTTSIKDSQTHPNNHQVIIVL